MIDISKIVVRSIVMGIATTVGMSYMATVNPDIITEVSVAAWLAACVSFVVFDKPGMD